ncbi:MAG: T6SS immunity protein Tli4 family protein, partial [Candidatus Thiodiazotropha sp.]
MMCRLTEFRWITAVLVSLLTGCGPGQATSGPENEQQSERAEAIRLAADTDHKIPKGMRQECLGRHVFDVRPDFEWGVPPLSFSNTEGMHTGFGELLFPEWGMSVDGVQLGVASDGTLEEAQGLAKSMISTEKNIIHGEERELEGRRRRSKTLQELKATDDSEDLLKAIEINRERIHSLEQSIALRKERLGKDTLDINLPDSAGYSLTAYLVRNGMFYTVGGVPVSDRPAPPAHYTRTEAKQWLITWLNRFRPRALFEIPTEPGVCFPYGFIADEGAFAHDLYASFRYADAPGVFYHLHSKTVGEKGPEPMFVQTAARALASQLNYRAAEAHSRSIGPRKVKIGALPAEQGGYELNYPSEDDRPVKTYSVFTGRGGKRGSMALPDLSVEMESYVPEQSAEITTDPPPLDESMERLEAF